jgi:molybdopterin-guanine dinucleotide biosynthesis protein A
MSEMERSGLILIGGRSSRAEYYPKYLLQYKGETFLKRQISILRTVCEEIIISCRDEEQCDQIKETGIDIRVTDIKKEAGPMEGINTGALAAHGKFLFIVACDMPFISPDVINYLFKTAESSDAAIPGWSDGNIEPLYAVYRKEALLRFFSTNSPRRLAEIAQGIQSHIVQIDAIKRLDPELISFTNINDLKMYRDLTADPV